jgi:tRNA (guanosine-2'-O-)-methyltransferase
MDRQAPDVFEPARAYTPRPWPKTWTAEGVVEVLEPLLFEQRIQRIHEVLDRRLTSVTVLMDAPHDPHNGAAILRSCDAFGVQEVHVVPREEAFLASNTVSKGSERWVDVVKHDSPSAAVAQLRASGFELIATHPEGELSPEDLPSIPRLALLMGNEHDGLCEELAQSAGRRVRIPMIGFVESLNVSVSAAVLLRAATLGRPGDLRDEAYQAVYAQALFRSVKRAGDVLAASRPL